MTLYFSSSMIWLWRVMLYVSDLGCYLPGRTFSIISPSVGADCSCLVSLRAKNHIRRTQFRKMYRGGSTGHMSELRCQKTHAHTNTQKTPKWNNHKLCSKGLRYFDHKWLTHQLWSRQERHLPETQTAFCAEPQLKLVQGWGVPPFSKPSSV